MIHYAIMNDSLLKHGRLKFYSKRESMQYDYPLSYVTETLFPLNETDTYE